MTTRRRPKRLIPIRDERGMALVVALWVTVMLFLLGVAFLGVSGLESSIASNEVKTATAFHLADAGVEHARRALINLGPSAVLGGASVFAGSNTANLAGGTYEVEVTNNYDGVGAEFPRGNIPEDPSGSAAVDADRILVVTSTGTFKGTQKTIEAVIQVKVSSPGAVYTMDGTDSPPSPIVEVEELAPGTSISGNDCNPPSAGGGPGPGPHVPGIAVESTDALNDIVGDIGPNNPKVTGVGGTGSVEEVPGAMNDADFDVWVNTLIAAATPVGAGACGGGTPPGAPLELGTWANPQVCFVVGDTNVLIPPGSSGAGIFVVQETSPTLDPMGADLRDFTYEGIVIVVGSGRVRLRGNSKIYGAVFQRNGTTEHSGETRLRLRDTSSICYSNVAVRTVQGMLTRDLLAWYER